MGIESILIIIIVLIIIIFQINVLSSTLKIINNYKNIFSFADNVKKLIVEKKVLKNYDQDSEFLMADEYYNYLELRVDNGNIVFSDIKTAINQYLRKNIGAISDFNLLKDIVERYCDSERENVNTQVPVPMYLGLMGTILGIIIGLIALISSGGIKDLASDTNGISSLLLGISMAMSVSFVGILATTIASWKNKDANSKNEKEKNEFYSFLQAELLPRIYKDSVSDLSTLENNLNKFNNIFTKNIVKFESSFETISNIVEDQKEVIELINNLDVKNLSKANVDVLKQINLNVAQFEHFNDYMIKTNEYVRDINKLNGTLNKQLTLQNSIEKMYTFFVDEMNQIEQRKSKMIDQVSNFDNTYNDTLNALKTNSQTNIEEFKKFVTEQIYSMRENMKTTNVLVDELKQLSATKKVLDNMNSLTNTQNNKIDSLIKSIEVFSKEVISMKSGNGSSRNAINRLTLFQRILLYMFVGSGTIISLVFIFLIAWKTFFIF